MKSRPARTPALRPEVIGGRIAQGHLEAVVGDLMACAATAGIGPWETLRAEARLQGKVADLAVIFDRAVSDPRVRDLDKSLRASILVEIAAFYADDYGDLEASRSLLTRVLEIEPAHVVAQGRLGAVLSGLGDTMALARFHLRNAEAREAIDGGVVELRKAAEQLERLPSSAENQGLLIDVYGRILARSPEDTATLAALESALERAGRLQELDRLLAERSGSEATPDVLAKRLEIHLGALGRPELALEDALILVEVAPDHPVLVHAVEPLLSDPAFRGRAAFILERAYAARGASEQVERMLGLQLAEARGVQRVDALDRLLSLRRELGDALGVWPVVRERFEVDPSERWRAALLEAAAAAGKERDAAQLLEAYLPREDVGARASAHQTLGDLWTIAGHKAAVSFHWQVALELLTDSATVRSLLVKLQALFPDDVEMTRGIAARIWCLSPTSGEPPPLSDQKHEVLLKGARTLLKSGDASSALEVYERALRQEFSAEIHDEFDAVARQVPKAWATRAQFLEKRAQTSPTEERWVWRMRQGFADASVGAHARALDAWRAIETETYSYAECQGRIVSLLRASHQDEEASVVLGAWAKRTVGLPRANLELELFALERSLGHNPVAVQHLQWAVTACPMHPELATTVCEALALDSGELSAARVADLAMEGLDARARAHWLEKLIETASGRPSLDDRRVQWWLQLIEARGSGARALDTALVAVTKEPQEISLWEKAEELAGDLHRAKDLGDCYRRFVLAGMGKMAAENYEEICRRGIDYVDEWLEDSERVVELLQKIVQEVPASNWAFDRLKLTYDSQERWGDLFALYDTAMSRAGSDAERIILLEDVAQIAKDFAADLDRAVRYHEELLAMRPGDARVRTALERLYERTKRHVPLIELLTAQMEGANPEKAQALRTRVAVLWLEGPRDLENAFRVVDRMLTADPQSHDAFDLLERILTLSEEMPATSVSGVPGARPRSVRQRAASLLKQRYRMDHRFEDLVRVLKVQLEAAPTPKERGRRLREIIAVQLDSLSDDLGAFENLRELVELEPEVLESRKELARLATRLERSEERFETLVQVANRHEQPEIRATLYDEASIVARYQLGDMDRAVSMAEKVVELAEGSPEEIPALRKLEGLLRQSEDVAALCNTLDRLSNLETDPSRVREVLGDIATIAHQQLQDDDRALAAWRRRLQTDEADLEALDGTVAVLEGARRWEELVEALERRAECAPPDVANRDRCRIAVLWETELSSREEAIQAWITVRAMFGPDLRSGEALERLFTEAERWPDLVSLYEQEVETADSSERSLAVWKKLGDLHRDRTNDIGGAVRAYRTALQLQPHDEPVRRGLESLLERATAPDDRSKVIVALEAFYRSEDDWRALGEIVEPRLELAQDDKSRVHILVETASLWLQRGGGADRCFDWLWRAFLLGPSTTGLADEVLRLSGQLKRWDRVERDLEGPLSSRKDLPAPVARDLWHRVGVWQRDVRNDPDAAERAFVRALAYDSGHVELLSSLAALQRRSQGRTLIDTLLRLSEATGDDLELLREAAETALDKLRDRVLARRVTERLLEVTLARWQSASGAPELADLGLGLVSPEQMSRWAIQTLAQIYEAEEESQRLVALYLDASKLPFPADERRAYLVNAAQRAPDSQALELYQALFDAVPEDALVAGRLELLLRKSGNLRALVRLRKRQIEIAADPVKRANARVEVAEMLVELGESAGAIAQLSRNFEELSLHPPSRALLVQLFERQEQSRELRDFWQEQSRREEASGNMAEAADCAVRSAAITEQKLFDQRLAIDGYERAAALGSLEAQFAIARLRTERSEHRLAAKALESIYDQTPPEARADIALQLADCYVAQGHPEWARARLERTLPQLGAERPRIRERLIGLLREAGDARALGELLVQDARDQSDVTKKIQILREAAELHLVTLEHPEGALPILLEASEAAPSDLGLKLLLSDVLARVGSSGRATEILEQTLANYGSRKPRDRAFVHHQLARVCLAGGDRARALAELDLATRMDPANADALLALARLSAEEGQLERARRKYRALLLLVRRGGRGSAPPRSTLQTWMSIAPSVRRPSMVPSQMTIPPSSVMSMPPSSSGAPSGPGPSPNLGPLPVTRSEILFELSELSRAMDDADSATDFWQSALQVARESVAEASGFEALLWQREKYDLLALWLEDRVADPTNPFAAASVHALAGLYEGPLHRASEAFELRLRGIGMGPLSNADFDATLNLARRTAQMHRLVAVLSEVVGTFQQPEASVRALLRLGQALEAERQDEQALEVYQRAEEILSPLPSGEMQEWDVVLAPSAVLDEVWQALEGLYGRLGDRESQASLLRKRIASVALMPVEPAQRAEPIYRLAALRFAAADLHDEAVALLQRALAIDPQPDRAEAMVRQGAMVAPRHEPTLRMMEEVARRFDRKAALVDALRLLAAMEGGGSQLLREAADVARSLGDVALEESVIGDVLLRGSGAPDIEPPDTIWAVVRTAELAEAAGDVDKAARYWDRAARGADGELVLAYGERALQGYEQRGATSSARSLLEHLLRRASAPEALRVRLLQIYKQEGDVAAQVALLSDLVESAGRGADGQRWRLELAELWVASNDGRARDLLEGLLAETPNSERGVELLARGLERRGQYDELVTFLTSHIAQASRAGLSAVATQWTLRLGAAHESEGFEAQALSLYETALEQFPGDEGLARAAARIRIRQDDSLDVGQSLAQLLELERGDAAADRALELAAFCTAQGDDPAAEAALEKGLAACPTRTDLERELESRYAKRGAWGELARLTARAARRAEAKQERMLGLNRAAELFRSAEGLAAEAANVLEELLWLSPDEARLRETVDALEDAGEFSEALRVLERFQREQGDSAWLAAAEAALREQRGEGAQAISAWHRAFHLGGDAYADSLAQALERAVAGPGKRPSAPPRTSSLPPGRTEETPRAPMTRSDRDLRVELATVLISKGDWERAREQLITLAEAWPKDLEVLRLLANVERERGDAGRALIVLRRLLTLETGEALISAVFSYADLCEAQGHLPDSRLALERARRMSPTDTRITDRLRRIYSLTGGSRELAELAVEDAEHATDVKSRVEHLVHAARLLVESKTDPERAVSLLEQVKTLLPDDVPARILLADAFRLAGRATEALATLRQLVLRQRGRKGRTLAEAYEKMAQLRLDAGEKDGALEALVRAVECDGQNAALQERMADLAFALEDMDAAARGYRALSLLRDLTLEQRARSRTRLAEIALHGGDRRRARSLLERALEEDPHYAPALALAERLGDS